MWKTYCSTLSKLRRAKIPALAVRAIGLQWRTRGLLTCFSLLLIVSYSVASASPPAGKDKPKGKIEVSEYTFDFGYMPQKAVFSHNFVVKNVGKGTLNIVKVDPICGCTTVPVKRAFLKPGEETELHVNFDSGKFKGHINKRIKILSTDPENGLVELFVRGVVGKSPKSVQISGPAVSFASIDVTKREVRIKNISLKKVTLSVLPMADSFFDASLSEQKIDPQQEATLTLKIKEALPLGEFKSSITVECVGEKTERFSIPITGMGYAR